MKISFKSFKYLALAGAIVASAAYADTRNCGATCAQAAQQASDSAKQSIIQQMTQSCSQIPDSNGRTQCYASIQATADQQAQSVYSYVYGSCMSSCGR
jgi:hypothetical protein